MIKSRTILCGFICMKNEKMQKLIFIFLLEIDEKEKCEYNKSTYKRT